MANRHVLHKGCSADVLRESTIVSTAQMEADFLLCFTVPWGAGSQNAAKYDENELASSSIETSCRWVCF